MNPFKSHILFFALPFIFCMNANPVPPIMENGWGNPENKITQMYPNPATTVINFTFQVKGSQQHILQIYSFIGKKMYEIRVPDTKLTVQLDENYYRGIYVYQLRDIAGRLIESGKFQVIK